MFHMSSTCVQYPCLQFSLFFACIKFGCIVSKSCMVTNGLARLWQLLEGGLEKCEWEFVEAVYKLALKPPPMPSLFVSTVPGLGPLHRLQVALLAQLVFPQPGQVQSPSENNPAERSSFLQTSMATLIRKVWLVTFGFLGRTGFDRVLKTKFVQFLI